MKLFSGLLALLFALLISGVAGYFSVIGLGALFAATFWPVVVMGTVLETGKLVAAGWLHANWSNARVNFLHKTYLTFAVLALMLVTAIGIYGYLSKGYLEQEAPLAGNSIQIEQREAGIRQKQAEIARLAAHQAQLDAAINSLIEQKAVIASQRLRDGQRAERAQIAADLVAANAEIVRLTNEIVPLRLHTSEVQAKLGPVKYVADLFGWQDPNSAVRLVILVIMFAFDPLAVVLVLSATISLGEWADARRARKASRIEPQTIDDLFPTTEARATIEQAVAAMEAQRKAEAPATAASVPVYDVAESRKLDEARSAAPVVPEEADPAQAQVSPAVRVVPVNRHFLSTSFEVVPAPFSQAPVAYMLPITPAEPTGDMDALMALLEKRPDLLDEIVTVITDWRDRNTEQAPSTPDDAEAPPTGPKNWLK